MWPGFITAICQYESSVMLCAEISHKILRSDTVLDAMYEMADKGTGFQYEAAKTFIGEIVLTTYNNKTYRVDDIDWEKNPTFKFKKGDVEMDLVTYYREQYNIEIKDLQQPLLVSMPKARDQKRGQTGPILLIPELSRLTGEYNMGPQFMDEFMPHVKHMHEPFLRVSIMTKYEGYVLIIW